jgi:two-component system KDP operon response regulator KdpE
MTEPGATKILIVDDEPKLLRVLEPSFKAAGYEVAIAETGGQAINLVAGTPFDVVILDLGLPDMDGKQVITRIRQWAETPIIVLSARNIEQEKIDALDLGAEDFVNKPFSMGELMARVRAALRRRDRQETATQTFRAGNLFIDFSRHRATVDAEEVHFSPREFELLRVLAQRSGQILTHKQIIAALWGHDGNADAQWVRVLVSNVRQKIEQVPSSAKILVTEPALGYRLVPDE